MKPEAPRAARLPRRERPGSVSGMRVFGLNLWGPGVVAIVALRCALAGGLAQTPMLTVADWPASVAAGRTAPFQLVALNTSAAPVTWHFPHPIVGRWTAGTATGTVVAELQDPMSAAAVTIAPGHFARREYVWSVPLTLTGAVTVTFGDLPVPRLVLDIQAPAAEVSLPPEEETAWQKRLRDAEPAEAGTGLEPGRFFKEHISGYEPFYFVAGTRSPNAKFQVSFKYRLLNDDGALAARAPALRGLHLAYMQTSLWDWNAPSAPFHDSSYQPELLHHWERVIGGDRTNAFRLDLQTGLLHESNGKGGADSRSLNFLYVRPTLVFGRDDSLQLKLLPRIGAYVGDLSDNPDLAAYRGYGDLRAVLGWQRGLQVSALGRVGDRGEHGSLQLDATYPMMRFLHGSFSLYLHAQYFTGYGDSLLDYRERSSQFRVGISLYR